MTNNQLAGARRVEGQFPNIRILKRGETLIPTRVGVEGASVEVTSTMSRSAVETTLRQSCAAING